jgi:hypothetical protein
LKLNGTHYLLVYADDVNVLGGSVHAIKKNSEVLVFAGKKISLEVNAEKTKYMVMSRNQNAGQNHSIPLDNISFERVEQFKYLVTTLTIEIPFRKKLNADRIRVIHVIIRCRIFCFPVCYQRHKDYNIQKYDFACYFVWM